MDSDSRILEWYTVKYFLEKNKGGVDEKGNEIVGFIKKVELIIEEASKIIEHKIETLDPKVYIGGELTGMLDNFNKYCFGDLNFNLEQCITSCK